MSTGEGGAILSVVMGRVIWINQKRVFTLEEAQELLPLVRRMTHSAQTRVRQRTTQISYLQDKEQRSKLEDEIFKIYQEWNEKIRKIGCEAKGMWLVDFDNGEGYYCWRHPELNLEYHHTYVDGFRGRVKIH